MMEIVEVIPHRPRTFEERPMISRVSLSRGEGRQLRVEEKMHRVGGNDEMNKETAEVENVLHRVHRHARPGTGVGIFMVIAVDGPHQRFPVDEPVDEVEMGFPPQGNDQEESNEPHGIRCERDQRHPPVGGEP